jgi:hypothetical protein
MYAITNAEQPEFYKLDMEMGCIESPTLLGL